jgi:hypothetical protein
LNLLRIHRELCSSLQQPAPKARKELSMKYIALKNQITRRILSFLGWRRHAHDFIRIPAARLIG